MNRSTALDWNVDLKLCSVRGRSFLDRQYVTYPYHITRLLYEDLQEKTTPKLILQSLSGGIYRAEQLHHKIELERSARIDIRTQGSTIVHSARGGPSSSRTVVSVGEDASIVYIPEPQIIFNGADFANEVSVHGVNQARHVVIADSFLAYDPEVDAAEIDFRFTMTNSFIDTEGSVLAIDNAMVRGISHQRVMNDYQGYASFMFYGQDFDDGFMADCCGEIERFEAEAAYSTLPSGAGYILKALAVDGIVLSRILDIVRSKCLVAANCDSGQTQAARLEAETATNRAANRP